MNFTEQNLDTKKILEIINSQVGCGYCKHEKSCLKRDPKVNKAKQGCLEYQHYLTK